MNKIIHNIFISIFVFYLSMNSQEIALKMIAENHSPYGIRFMPEIVASEVNTSTLTLLYDVLDDMENIIQSSKKNIKDDLYRRIKEQQEESLTSKLPIDI